MIGALPPQASSHASSFARITIWTVDARGDQTAGVYVQIAASNVLLGSFVSGQGPAEVELDENYAHIRLRAEYQSSVVFADLSPRTQEFVLKLNVLAEARVRRRPEARCPDGTTGVPCVVCKIGESRVRICV